MIAGFTRLQVRIAIALTSIVVLMVVVQGYLAYSSLEQQEDDLVDQIVASEAHRLVDRIARGDELLATDGSPTVMTTRFRAWLLPPSPRGGWVPADDLSAQARDLHTGPLMIYEGQRVLHFLATQTPSGRLILEYDATNDEAFVEQFGLYLVASGFVIILLASAVSMGIARVVVAPLRRLAVQLSRWSPGSQPPVGGSDEETLLLEAFDAAQRRLEESHAREREFAANVRHEVRTPLSALRTDVEMLLLNHPRPAADEQRLLRMQATVDAIAADIESMHNLAYGRRSEPEPVDLATCLNDVWAGLQHRNPHGTLVLDSQLAPGDVVILDRLALMTVLRNLLRNAIDHAAPGRCVARRLPQGIAISDDGPGIDPDNLARIFDRFFSLPRSDRHEANPGGAESIGADRGLGLAIARHTALGQDWHLHATSEPGRGTTFTLDFQR